MESSNTLLAGGRTNDEKMFDRQIRLWGPQGQRKIRTGKCLVFGSSTIITETMRNLVLPGLGSYWMIDDSRVGTYDIASNFFLNHTMHNEYRAVCVSNALMRLNPMTTPNVIIAPITDFITNYTNSNSNNLTSVSSKADSDVALTMGNIPPLSSFSVVIIDAALAHLSSIISLDIACESVGVQLVVLNTLGTLGSVRVSANNRSIIETKGRTDRNLGLSYSSLSTFPDLVHYALTPQFDVFDLKLDYQRESEDSETDEDLGMTSTQVFPPGHCTTWSRGTAATARSHTVAVVLFIRGLYTHFHGRYFSDCDWGFTGKEGVERVGCGCSSTSACEKTLSTSRTLLSLPRFNNSHLPALKTYLYSLRWERDNANFMDLDRLFTQGYMRELSYSSLHVSRAIDRVVKKYCCCSVIHGVEDDCSSVGTAVTRPPFGQAVGLLDVTPLDYSLDLDLAGGRVGGCSDKMSHSTAASTSSTTSTPTSDVVEGVVDVEDVVDPVPFTVSLDDIPNISFPSNPRSSSASSDPTNSTPNTTTSPNSLSSTAFALVCIALYAFSSHPRLSNGSLPFHVSLPDLHADTQSYTSLRLLYRTRYERDVTLFEQVLRATVDKYCLSSVEKHCHSSGSGSQESKEERDTPQAIVDYQSFLDVCVWTWGVDKGNVVSFLVQNAADLMHQNLRRLFEELVYDLEYSAYSDSTLSFDPTNITLAAIGVDGVGVDGVGDSPSSSMSPLSPLSPSPLSPSPLSPFSSLSRSLPPYTDGLQSYIDDVQDEPHNYPDGTVDNSHWYIALRAAKVFTDRYGRYPGQYVVDVYQDEDEDSASASSLDIPESVVCRGVLSVSGGMARQLGCARASCDININGVPDGVGVGVGVGWGCFVQTQVSVPPLPSQSSHGVGVGVGVGDLSFSVYTLPSLIHRNVNYTSPSHTLDDEDEELQDEDSPRAVWRRDVPVLYDIYCNMISRYSQVPDHNVCLPPSDPQVSPRSSRPRSPNDHLLLTPNIDVCDEVCRVAGVPIHTVAAAAGAMGADVALKMVMNQYALPNNFLLYNSLFQFASVFEV